MMLSGVFVGGFVAAACVASPEEEEVAAGTVEQAIGGTTKEREITYYSGPDKRTEVGECTGPYRCYGPKGLQCTGTTSDFFTIVWHDCGTP